MTKKILVLSGSPKKRGNTAKLVQWFAEGACLKNAQVEVIETAFLKSRSMGCVSCRKCQTHKHYECAIDDPVRQVLEKMIQADVIVMATPLYFFGASAQLKQVVDRMFSLYKWDNEAGTMTTPLKGKTMVLLASAYEDVGLEALEKPFRLTAEYTSMRFESMLVADAGVSGQIAKVVGVREKALALGQKVA